MGSISEKKYYVFHLCVRHDYLKVKHITVYPEDTLKVARLRMHAMISSQVCPSMFEYCKLASETIEDYIKKHAKTDTAIREAVEKYGQDRGIWICDETRIWDGDYFSIGKMGEAWHYDIEHAFMFKYEAAALTFPTEKNKEQE